MSESAIAAPPTLFPAWCDAVVMLTWSDWHLEPRSNRFHYATRFARHLPVYFVQPDSFVQEISSEKVSGHNIEVVHVASQDSDSRAKAIQAFLRTRGVRNPLMWIYNPNFERFVALSGAPMRIFHATEDYLGSNGPLAKSTGGAELIETISRMIAQCDLVVAVSDGVADNFRVNGQYSGDMIVLRNGCDFSFWQASGAAFDAPSEDAPDTAIFQGNLNGRVDYDLLIELTERMPDWTFEFCGQIAHAPAGWQTLSSRPNVRYLGVLEPQAIADAARGARVGLIPFEQADYIWRSLPLKAYEYLACGLPVVSVPIEEMQKHPEMFAIASGSAAFEAAMRERAASRADPEMINKRLAHARRVSYDECFEQLLSRMKTTMRTIEEWRPRLNILMFYDERSAHLSRVQSSLDAFSLHSSCRMHFMSGTAIWGPTFEPIDLRMFDAVIIHDSIDLSAAQHLGHDIAASIEIYDGPKLLLSGKELKNTERLRRWIERMSIDCVFTRVPEPSIARVYPPDRFGMVDFLQMRDAPATESSAGQYVRRTAERGISLCSRWSNPPLLAGRSGYEAKWAAQETKRLAVECGLIVDFAEYASGTPASEWHQLLGSSRAIFVAPPISLPLDDSGALEDLASQHHAMSHTEFAQRFLLQQDEPIRLHEIPSVIFDAISMRTALVLFEGEYGDVLTPGRHYLALKSDLSNAEDIFEKIKDDDVISAMTQQAYEDIIASGRHSLGRVVDDVDDYLQKRARGRKRATLVTLPILAVAAGQQMQIAQRKGSLRPILDQVIPPDVFTQDQIYNHLLPAGAQLFPTPARSTEAQIEKVMMVLEAVAADLKGMGAAVQQIIESQRPPLWYRGVQAMWHVVPASVRSRLRTLRGR
ncbi:glycosyltransferase [Bradyrhizobium sp. 2S1]|uniref:glycosyltransferase n=1 Tax=Bradyrhizobium sp. 2S1 TaxID=1404429 RepID=UPI00140C57BC|nr:glycosyltransferase [Bradyrhizobium sp. 2S1]MCK7670913.1 glycosyltransferase [Bradyrhizobium sp. 2S1]